MPSQKDNDEERLERVRAEMERLRRKPEKLVNWPNPAPEERTPQKDVAPSPPSRSPKNRPKPDR
jgi:hypothetical protein